MFSHVAFTIKCIFLTISCYGFSYKAIWGGMERAELKSRTDEHSCSINEGKMLYMLTLYSLCLLLGPMHAPPCTSAVHTCVLLHRRAGPHHSDNTFAYVTLHQRLTDYGVQILLITAPTPHTLWYTSLVDHCTISYLQFWHLYVTVLFIIHNWRRTMFCGN